MIKLDDSWSSGPREPPQWSGQESSSNFGPEFPHNRPPRPKQDLFSSQNKTRRGLVWYQIILDFEEQIWWRLVFHLLLIFQGKWAKMEYLTNYLAVSLHFCCNNMYSSKEHHWFKNVPDWCSSWWDLAGWQWKVGLTPWTIRRVPGLAVFKLKCYQSATCGC